MKRIMTRPPKCWHKLSTNHQPGSQVYYKETKWFQNYTEEKNMKHQGLTVEHLSV